jgi:Flp pilus assembly protein TadD
MHHMRQRADAARDNREYMKAALFYEKALRHVPDHAGVHVQCGHMFKEAGELDQAEQHYDKARMLMPNDPDLALQFGHFYKVAGRLDEAERCYRKAAELMPGAPEPLDELAGLLRNRWNGEHGLQRLTAFPPRKSYRAAAEVQRPAPTDPAGSQPAGGKTVHPIRRAAASLYEKALEVAPNDAALRIKCAHLFKAEGNLARAAHHYREAQLLAPDDPDIALQLGCFHCTCGRLREAELSFRKAVKLAPNWPEPAEQLGELYGRGWRIRHMDGDVHPNGRDSTSYSLSKAAEPIADGEGGLNGFSINKLLRPSSRHGRLRVTFTPTPSKLRSGNSDACNGPIGGCTPPFAVSRRSAAFASRPLPLQTCG